MSDPHFIFSSSWAAVTLCAHKRIVNIMKVYIEKNNMQGELIRFHTKISTLFTFTFAQRGIPRLTLCLHVDSLAKLN